ncbi:MAG: dihydrolipoyl dehydrogenase [Flavobacteriales bacterium]|nr:dihydrolipoyl dehydrogenase [Flavobacteriales bacterium]
MENNYDIIIIGAGPGGYVAAIRAAQLGLRTAIIEKENMGGVCLNWGCIPTKALLKSASVYEYLHHASDYGITVNTDAEADFSKVIERSRGVASAMSRGIDFLMKKNKIDVIMGLACLLPDHKVEVTDVEGAKKTFTAPHIIIATGAHSRSLPSIPQNGRNIIGYREALTLKKQPKNMVVIGSGAIGTEMAYFYNAMGTQVTIVEFLPAIVPVEDADVSKEIERIFRKRGIKSMTSSSVEKVTENTDGTLTVYVSTPKGAVELSSDVVLCAVGIKTNIEGIGLENVGIKTEKDKIKTDSFYQTNVEGYYAIGDVVGGPSLAHVASAEGIIAVEKIAGLDAQPLDYGNIPGAIYTTPQIASVGMTEKKALEAGYEIKVGKFPFSASGKAKAAGTSEGFVKVIFDAKYGELLGVHMIGDNVTEMIAEAVLARKGELTAEEILHTVHPHPTMSEAFMEAVEAAYDHAIHI